MLQQEKLNFIRDYLRTEFKGFDLVHDNDDMDRQGHTFQLDKDNKIRLVTVQRNVTDNVTGPKLSTFLQGYPLRQHFDNENVKRIVISENGIKLEYS